MTPHRRRGVTALMVALCIPVLLAFVAVVVDIGYARVVQAQLQAAADAAAESSAAELDRTATGVDRARSVAIWVAAQNQAHGGPVVLDSDDVAFGIWDAAGATFQPSADPEQINAVRVQASRDDLTPFFGRVAFGTTALGAAVVSVAARGGELGAGEVPYYLPFGLPSCIMDGNDPEEIMDMVFELSPAAADNTGWGLVGVGTDASGLRDHITAILPCMEQWANEGHIDTPCAPAAVDDEVDLNNGVAASAHKALSDAMANGIPWNADVWGPLPPRHPGSTVPAAVYGTVLEGPIPIFDGGAYCSGSEAWNETFPVVGFAWGVIYDVRSSGKAADRNVWIRLDLSQVYDVGDWFGGGSWGVTFHGPAVVVR